MAKWTPGQKLNSAAEVMQALLDGERVRSEWWLDRLTFIHLVDNKIIFSDGEFAAPDFNLGGWHIYTPPKREIKSERFFAVVGDIASPEGVEWMGPYELESSAKGYHPNALTYVKAECEVEIEE